MKVGSLIGVILAAVAAGWIGFAFGVGAGNTIDYSAGLGGVAFLVVLLAGLALIGAFTPQPPEDP